MKYLIFDMDGVLVNSTPCHDRAFRALLPGAGPVRRIVVVGGGLFPRTPLVLARLIPDAEITVVVWSISHALAPRGRSGRQSHDFASL